MLFSAIVKSSRFLPVKNNNIKFRNIHSSSAVMRFHEDHPKGDYYDKKVEDELYKELGRKWYGYKDGFKDIRQEIKKWKNEVKHDFVKEPEIVNHGDREKIWKFETQEDLDKWTTVADSDHDEGFSKCELKLNPNGKGLFHGYINSDPPKDGRVKRAGYCAMKTHKLFRSFGRREHLNFDSYQALVMRIRGDGRCYLINLDTSGHFDITWNDVYHYILYTRGGPYWQFVKIPFSKFYFASKGRIQDKQCEVPRHMISTIGFTAAKEDGPFKLEFDYIGVECDAFLTEEFAYEMYQNDRFQIGV